jgi:hypothetical protein
LACTRLCAADLAALGLTAWLNYEDNTLAYAVVSPHYYSLQLHMTINLAEVSAMRFEMLNGNDGKG